MIPLFFGKVFNLLPTIVNTHLIVGGDFNLVLDLVLDRFPSRADISLTNSAIVLNDLMASLDLVDIWRLKYSTDKQYTFFSQVHKSYSRTDFFLIDSKIISCVKSIKHHNRIISDHSAVTLSLDLSEIRPSYNWRFNPTLLLDSGFCEHLTELLAEFLKFNDTGEVSDSILWETLKSVLRGHIISYECSLKKQREKRLLEIDNRLSQLEDAYRDSTDSDLLNEIAALKFEYN